MARKTLKGFIDGDNREEIRRLQTAISTLNGAYEYELTPRRNGRSLAQLRYYWAVVVASLSDFLRDQEYADWQPDACHGILKEKCLRVAVANPETGEVLSMRTKSTGELDTVGMMEYIEDCRVYLDDKFGIPTPDPTPDYARDKAGAR